MPIVKSFPRIAYASIPNALLQDRRLSFDERGMLAYLLSRPETWQISPTDLANEGGIGTQKVQKMLKHLIELGYCTRERIRDEQTMRFTDILYTVFDSPQVEKPHVEKPRVENHPQVSKEDLVSKDSKKSPLPPEGERSELFKSIARELFNVKREVKAKRTVKRIEGLEELIVSMEVDVTTFNAFVAWYRRDKPNLSLPCNPDTVEKNLNQYLATAQKSASKWKEAK